jgi:hypothetical protein
MSNAILVQNAVMATNIDALNRSVISAEDIQNGNVFNMNGQSATAGQTEVWNALKPATGALKLSLKLLGTTYISVADGSIGTQRVVAYKFEVAEASGGLWMAYEPEVVTIVTASGKKFKGIDADVRDFANIAGTPFSAFKPQVGDILTISADGITGTISTNTYAVATNGQYALAWAAAAN